MDMKFDLEELKQNVTNSFSYTPKIGREGITLEVTKEYADSIGAVYNDYVNPEVNIIIRDNKAVVLKGTAISDNCISAYKEIKTIKYDEIYNFVNDIQSTNDCCITL